MENNAYRKIDVIRIEKNIYNVKIAIYRIGQGKHQKAWKQEIWRVHNFNPLKRPSHVH